MTATTTTTTTTMTRPSALAPTQGSRVALRQAFVGITLVAQAVIDGPIGPLTALATKQGIAGLWFDNQTHHPGKLDAPLDAGNAHIALTQRWLDAYWAGREPSPHGVPLDLHGTPFQRAVWLALLAIPFGRSRSYGEIAAQVGPGAAPRATGAAVGRNPVSILVPCHRVIGADGSLVGYAGGLQRKQRLLQHEGVLLA